MDLNNLANSLHPLERKILPFLGKYKKQRDLEEKSGLQEIEISRALQWLENKQVIKVSKNSIEIVEIGNNGEKYLKTGLPEKQFLKVIENKPLSLQEIKVKTGLSDQELSISLGALKSKSAIILDKQIKITETGKKLLNSLFPEEVFLRKLPIDKEKLNNEDKRCLELLLKRKEIVYVLAKKDVNIELTDIGKKLAGMKISENLIDNVTTDLIKNQEWKNKTFRRYDVEVSVPKIYPGKRHFINEAKNYARKVWLDMGFKEMTGPIINTSFWNFDSLFVPQDHPAREMQDTFFIKGDGKLPEKDFLEKVKKQHESSWKYKWSELEAKKLVLRTHTTVLSARTLARLKKEELPTKYFAIGRNYRNETLDWSHLFEFNQSEGIVIDENANLRHLLGYLKEFFTKMGYEKVRFRPAYFPYTEPSVEIEVFLKEKNAWIELGGAGMFRPEVVKPLMGRDIPVLAWGFGLGRVVCPYFGIKDLRDFYKNDLKQLKEMKVWI
ncbi:phenylalanine--tRNA ligase subunit alpha [Candidatus Woesearchaeota archaeon]|nr:phenylalanine--tRNA ligase subunit alpha [Candidatus Woesearchaeota archaeon]